MIRTSNQLHQADFDRDPLLTDRLIILRRVDGHAVWVSPRVIKLMGDIPQEVEGGAILRDASGQPTGIPISACHRRQTHGISLRDFPR